MPIGNPARAIFFAALVLILASPAVAQDAASVARGLEAQYQAALIRERRLADDREQMLIANAETLLREARTQADARVAGAETALEQARTTYAELVGQIALRDSAARVEIEAYRDEARGLAQRASAELLQAYQRFADGDRVGAWPVIESLTQAQIRARMAAAVEPLRDMARLREIMRQNEEATAQQVMQLLDQAAALAPETHDALVLRALIERDLFHFERAVEAARRAVATATTAEETRRATDLLELCVGLSLGFTRQMFTGDDWPAFVTTTRAEAERDLMDARRLAANSLDESASAALGDALERAGRWSRLESLRAENILDPDPIRYDQAQAYFREAIEIRESLYGAAPEPWSRRRPLLLSLCNADGSDDQTRILALTRDKVDEMRGDDVLIACVQGAYIVKILEAIREGPIESAAAHASDWVAFARRLGSRRLIAQALNEQGGTALRSREYEIAMASFRESLAISRELAASDPMNVVWHNQILSSLEGLSRIPGSGVNWTDVIAHLEQMRSQADIWSARHERQLQRARERAGGG